MYITQDQIKIGDDWQVIGDFIHTFKNPGKGKLAGKPMTRQTIYNRIKQEKARPGSTGIDVLEIAGICFLRMSKP